MKFGIELKKKRGPLTQREAAALLEVSLRTFQQWEQHRQVPAPYVRRFVIEKLEEVGE